MTDLLPLIPFDTALERVADDPRRAAGYVLWLTPSSPLLAHCQTHPLVVDARLAYAEYEGEK